MKYREYEGVNTIESEITCPYCKHQWSDSWDFGWDDDEGDDLECDECGKKFYVHKCVSIDYRSHQNCSKNNEEHEWEKSFWDDKGETETCKKCNMNRYPIEENK